MVWKEIWPLLQNKVRPFLEEETPGKEMAIMDEEGVRKPLSGIAQLIGTQRHQSPEKAGTSPWKRYYKATVGAATLDNMVRNPPQIS